MTDEPKRRGRPRREDAGALLLDATRTLLDEVGYAAFNVDVIAERTGIAKTTIYRRWPTKSALVAAAIDAPVATDPDEILRESETLLAKLEGADVDLLRAVLAPRHERLRDAIGERADELLGAILLRVIRVNSK